MQDFVLRQRPCVVVCRAAGFEVGSVVLLWGLFGGCSVLVVVIEVAVMIWMAKDSLNYTPSSVESVISPATDGEAKCIFSH